MKRVMNYHHLWVSAVLTAVLGAEVHLGSVFTDGLVLQREAEVALWGMAAPQEEVTLSASWGARATTQADTDGKWRVEIETVEAGGPYEVKVSSGESMVVLEDVLLGDVWFCSGQSNMEWRVQQFYSKKERQAYGAEGAPIRVLTTPYACSVTPLEELRAKKRWTPVNAQTVSRVSATAYFFARQLHRELEVPIGVIVSAWGGRKIEMFTPMRVQKEVDYIQQDYDKRMAQLEAIRADDEPYQAYLKAKAEWQKWKRKGRPDPAVAQPVEVVHPLNKGVLPGGIYNGMVHPYRDFKIKGVIWYQGESNANLDAESQTQSATHYSILLKRMVASWRRHWGEVPFYYVQLPEWTEAWERPAELEQYWPRIRQSMLEAHREIDQSGMAVTLGLGEAHDIHPRRKKEVGERLARLALHQTYGLDLVYGGPLAEACQFSPQKAVVTFDTGGAPLQKADLTGFAAEDGVGQVVSVVASVRSENEVEIQIPEGTRAVYYAWANNPKGANLKNSEGLPASTFRFIKQD